MQELKNIIESLLFVSEEPLSVDKIKGVIESADNKEIRNALRELSDEYLSRAGGFYLCEVAGGYQLRSQPAYHEYIKRLLQPSPQRLSRAALETLAVVAYHQPVIRADIEHIRGVDCGSMLRQLMERKLLRVLGRKEIPGRPLIYATTKTFLELFELKDLSELPTPAEIEQMGAVFNPDPADDSPGLDHEAESTNGEESHAGDASTAQSDAGETGHQPSEPGAVPMSPKTATDDNPAPATPAEQEADSVPMMEDAQPSADKPETVPQQLDSDDRPANQQEPVWDGDS